jgi:hypothetical protein
MKSDKDLIDQLIESGDIKLYQTYEKPKSGMGINASRYKDFSMTIEYLNIKLEIARERSILANSILAKEALKFILLYQFND